MPTSVSPTSVSPTSVSLWSATASLSAIAVAVIVALSFSQSAFAQDLRQTLHNLTRSATIPTPDAGQVCVFCHTPSAPKETNAAQPLWQHSVPSTYVFPIFDDIGRIGLEGNTAIGSQSLACLSCHDGNQAYSVTRLSFDHPYGVPYRGALAPVQRDLAREQARRSGAPMREAQQLKFETEFRPAYRSIVDNHPVWWLSRFGGMDRRGRYDLPLYVRRDEADNSEVPFIECASCHDPHSPNPLFLRTFPGDGGICLSCHVR